ncbi:alpha/beta hydrolase [Phormidesmis priestleyi]
MSNHLLAIYRLAVENGKFPGYFVVSTAPINVEDRSQVNPQTDPNRAIQEITQYLKDHPDDAEILVMIHGYNTPKSGAEDWYKKTCEYISQNYAEIPKGLLAIGYRWSSEQIVEDESGSFQDKREAAKQALPKVMSIVTRSGLVGLIAGVIGTLISIFITLFKVYSGLELLLSFGFLLVLSLVAVAPILTIIALRLTVYFRDTFRASNYGVADFVEFIRQLDSALVEQIEGDDLFELPARGRAQKLADWSQRKIRLSFIGHSMGAFVVTNAVRILSDVFDPGSIGSLDVDNRNKCPSSDIGNVFRLGKLILVAPDISAESIISGRANTLRSSLRRFEEAYLFSNEGDMALRLASTSANYFTFPARTRDGGYRLGNVIVRNQLPNRKRNLSSIVNLSETGQLLTPTDDRLTVKDSTFLNYLFIREKTSLAARQELIGLEEKQKSIAELFTYFDCTDYKEKYIDPKTKQEKEIGIVSKAIGKQFLGFWDYVSLSLDFFTGKVDTHGGYIFSPYADLSKRLIYGLSCLGFEKFLASLETDPLFPKSLEEIKVQRSDLNPIQQKELALLQTLSYLCGSKGIQVLLAPERYEVDILGGAIDRGGY